MKELESLKISLNKELSKKNDIDWDYVILLEKHIKRLT